MESAHASIKIAVKTLGAVAFMTQDVPYVGIVSKVLAELLKIENVRLIGLLLMSPSVDPHIGTR